MKVEMTLDNL